MIINDTVEAIGEQIDVHQTVEIKENSSGRREKK
jgi:hypothetical protein